MSEGTKSKKNDVLDMKNRIKIRIINNFKQKKKLIFRVKAIVLALTWIILTFIASIL